MNCRIFTAAAVFVLMLTSALPADEVLAWKGEIRGIAAGDLNGDGLDDLVVCSPDEGATLLWRTAGTPFSSSPRRLFPGKYFNAAVFDMDRDGKSDLLVTEYQHYLLLWLQADDFQEKKPYYHHGVCTCAPVAIRDGEVIDLYCGSALRRFTSLAGNPARGYVMPPVGVSRSLTSPVLHDVDGNGKYDLLLLSPEGLRIYYGPVSLMQHWRPEMASATKLFREVTMECSFAVFDADDVGVEAVLFSSPKIGTRIFRQGRFDDFDNSRAESFSPFGGILLSRDMDGDGKAELVIVDRSHVRVFRAGNPQPVASVRHGVTSPRAAVAGNFNGKAPCGVAVAGKNRISLVFPELSAAQGQ